MPAAEGPHLPHQKIRVDSSSKKSIITTGKYSADESDSPDEESQNSGHEHVGKVTERPNTKKTPTAIPKPRVGSIKVAKLSSGKDTPVDLAQAEPTDQSSKDQPTQAQSRGELTPKSYADVVRSTLDPGGPGHDQTRKSGSLYERAIQQRSPQAKPKSREALFAAAKEHGQGASRLSTFTRPPSRPLSVGNHEHWAYRDFFSTFI